MALEWDLTKVTDWQDIDPARRESMIWMTMIVGIGEINDATVQKFFERVYAYERINGAMVRTPNGDRYTTPADIRRFMGLKTNVWGPRGPISKTDAAFAKDLARWATESAAHEWARAETPATT